MRKVRKQATYVSNVIIGADYGKSKTIPDQAVSVAEMLFKYSRGIPLPQERQGEYFGDVFIPDFGAMDISELAEYKMELMSNQKELEAQLKAQNAEVVKRKNEQRFGEKSGEIKDTLTDVNEPSQPV